MTPDQPKAKTEAQIAKQEAMETSLQRQKEAELPNDRKIPVTMSKKAEGLLDLLNRRHTAEALIDDLKKSLNKDSEGASNALRSWLGEGNSSRSK